MIANELYEKWKKLSTDDLKFLYSFINSNQQIFKETIERLSAYTAYRHLPDDEKIEFGVYSSELDPYFFLLEDEEIERIERCWPPYPSIIFELYKRKGLSEEEIEVLGKRTISPIKARRLNKEKKKILETYGLFSNEFERIGEKEKEILWKRTRILMPIFYGTTALSIYFYSKDPMLSLLTWIPYPITYNLLREVANRTKKKSIKKLIDNGITAHWLLTSPVSYGLFTLTFGLGSSLISLGVEKLWPYTPRMIKKILYITQNKLSGLNTKEFNERELRELLYNINTDSQSMPQSAIEKYKEQIDNGMIEIEDPRKTLLSPYSIAYHRRKAVAVKEGKEVRIIDKKYVKRLAEIENVSEEKMEKKLKIVPEEYLGFAVKDGRIYYVRDIIGILPCKIEEGLAYKEAYLTILYKKGDYIFSTYGLI